MFGLSKKERQVHSPDPSTLARITWELAAKVIPPMDRGSFPDPKWSEEQYWKSAEAVLDKARETVNRTLK